MFKNLKLSGQKSEKDKYVSISIITSFCIALSFNSQVQVRKAHQWSTKIFWEIYPCKKFSSPLTHTDCQGGGGEAGQPLGKGVFGQFSFARNCVATLHLATLMFLGGNHMG